MDQLYHRLEEFKKSKQPTQFTKEQIDEIETSIAKDSDVLHSYLLKRLFDTDANYGYIYCIKNEMYDYYGENVYKLGCALDVDKRLIGYITSYVKKSEICYSVKIPHYKAGERYLFYLLKDHRLVADREFFDCKLDIIKAQMDEVGKIMQDVTQRFNVLNTHDLCNNEKRIINNYIIKLSEICSVEWLKPVTIPWMINNKKLVTISDIMMANDITEEQYNLLNVRGHITSHEDKTAIERYRYKKYWKINEITTEFLDKFHGKTDILFNARYLLGIDNTGAGTADSKIAEKLDIVNGVIVGLGYDNINDTKAIDKKTFDENIKNVLISCKLFTEFDKSCILLSVATRYKNNKFMSTKSFLGFINTIFKDWGFCVELIRKVRKTKMINGKRNNISMCFYKISKNEIMGHA